MKNFTKIFRIIAIGTIIMVGITTVFAQNAKQQAPTKNQQQQVQSQQTRLSGTYSHNYSNQFDSNQDMTANITFRGNNFNYDGITSHAIFAGTYTVSGNRLTLTYKGECCCLGTITDIWTIVDSNTVRNNSGVLYRKK